VPTSRPKLHKLPGLNRCGKFQDKRTRLTASVKSAQRPFRHMNLQEPPCVSAVLLKSPVRESRHTNKRLTMMKRWLVVRTATQRMIAGGRGLWWLSLLLRALLLMRWWLSKTLGRERRGVSRQRLLAVLGSLR
jgi:hypothetical protein